MQLSPDTVKGLVENRIEFLKRMGLTVLELAPGYVKLMAPLKGNENHIGGMYAGALFTLAEIPGGVLILTSFDPAKCVPVIKELTIKFLRPAGSDITIEVALSPDEIERISLDMSDQGKAEFVLNGELKDTDGNVVAKSRGLYHIRLSDKAWTMSGS